MFKKYLKDMKAVWKPATFTYLLAVGISVLTGMSMEVVFAAIFGLIFLSIFTWAGYLYFKKGK